MYTLRNIFSSIIQKVSADTEKKSIYVNGGVNQVNGGVNGGINQVNGAINQVNGGINRDYATFDQEVISRTNYLLQNKE